MPTRATWTEKDRLDTLARVPMTTAMRDQIDAAAKAHGTTRAQLMRHATWAWLQLHWTETETAVTR